jgi:hypothetical protein
MRSGTGFPEGDLLGVSLVPWGFRNSNGLNGTPTPPPMPFVGRSSEDIAQCLGTVVGRDAREIAQPKDQRIGLRAGDPMSHCRTIKLKARLD